MSTDDKHQQERDRALKVANQERCAQLLDAYAERRRRLQQKIRAKLK